MTAIDVFSKVGYIISLKNKNAATLVDAFKQLFKQTKMVINLQTDQGGEFYNKKVQQLFKEYKINHYSSFSEFKASVVERFNRTIKNKLYRIFTYRGSYKYLDILPKVLNSYNNSKHRSIGMAPNKVSVKLEPEIFKRLYGFKKNTSFKFKVGNQVRISKSKKAFHRGYLPNWSEEIFLVYKRFSSTPPTYILKDLKDEILKGAFYESELQLVVKRSQDFWRVESILKSRGKGANKEYFVKWKGFDDRFNSYIKASWIK